MAPTGGDAPDPAAGRTLTVLGCDGSYPGPHGAASGYLVRDGATAVWLDAGPGTFAALQGVLDPAELDAVVLSHEHPDHWTDVESLVVWKLVHDHATPITVYAPPGLRARSYCADHPLVDWVDVHPSDRVVLGPTRLDLRFVATDHGPPTLAVRVDPADAGGDLAGSLAYSADTGPDWAIEELGIGIGTVLCEATFTAEREGSHQHLSGRQAGAMAERAGAGTLVLTHRWPTVPAAAVAAEARQSFTGTLVQAAPGLVVEW